MIYSLTATVVGAPRMISQPVSGFCLMETEQDKKKVK